jgi:hypothetical protein
MSSNEIPEACPFSHVPHDFRSSRRADLKGFGSPIPYSKRPCNVESPESCRSSAICVRGTEPSATLTPIV